MVAPGGQCPSCGTDLQWCFIGERMMVQCRYCLWMFDEDEGGMVVAGVSTCKGGDGGTVTMPEGWWRSVLAECEGSGIMQEVSDG